MKKAIFSLCGLLAFSTTFFGQYLSFTSGIQSISAESTLPVRTFENGGALSCTVTYNFTAATISEQEVSGEVYQFLHIDGFAKMGQVGAPALPAHNEIIAMPRNSSGRIIMLESSFFEYPGYMIHPALEPAIDTEGAEEPEFEKDEIIYSTNSFFPENVVEIIDVGLSRGTPLAKTQVRPVQFNPVTGVIRVYTKISYRIDFEGGYGSFDYIAQENSLHYTNLLKLNVLNSESIPDGIAYSTINSSSGGRTGEKNYIIVTHDQYLSQANQLANWKRQMGYTVEVVSQASWTAAEVKSEIQTRYNSWTPHPDYFVIIGDHTGSYAVPGEIHQAPNTSNFATDLYYACMDGIGDWHPDMAHGRISVSSTTEAGVVVDKIIDYEKTPTTTASFYTNMLSCAQYQDDDNNGYADRRFCHTSEDIRDYLQNSHSYTSERVYYTSTIAPVASLRYNNGYYSSGQLLPSALRSLSFNWLGNSTDITNAINNGKFLVFHRDHGYTGGSGWANPYYTTSTMESLTNGALLPVVFSMNCHTGEFQLSNCFADKFVCMDNKGAIGVVAAAYYSYSGFNDALSEGMIDAIWANPGLYPVFGAGGTGANYTIGAGNEIYTMGDVVNQGLYAMEQNWSGSSTYDKYQYELFHYFGDPAMKIWTANPNSNAITATHSSTIDCAGTSFAISNSTPNATATLVVNDELIAEIILNGSGNGTLAYSITATGPAVLLTISKLNHKPYVYSLTMNGSCTFPPGVETQATICVGVSTASAQGNIVHDFGSSVIESGVVFGTNPNPEINSSGVTKIQTSPTVTTGSFTINLTGLGSNTTYCLRAYARNTNGTGYGENDVFTTSPGPVILPWTEDWENAGTSFYTADQTCLDGLPEWDYNMVDAGGRLRFEAGSGFYHGGSRAATLDRYPSGALNTNYLIATLDLSNYSSSTDLELSFYYMHHGEDNHINDRVWVRGNNTSAWVEIYNLFANQGTAGNWNTVSNLDIDATLAAAYPSQTVSSTFQLRFGQLDNYPAYTTTQSDGYTFDDISITKLSPLTNLNVQNVAISDNQSECFDATNIITVAGSGSTVVIYSGGEANFIAGSKVVFNPGFFAHPGSEVNAYITTSGDYCSSLAPLVANTVNNEVISEIPDMVIYLSPEIKIYPNPSKGQFNIDFINNEILAEIYVFNIQGMKVYQTTCKEQSNKEVDISYLPAGMYLIVIKTDNKVLREKLIIN